jgi:poly(beta-D-mannuronate) lyase
MKKSQWCLFSFLMVSNLLTQTCPAMEPPLIVNSLSSLQEAINKALPGETIIMADGVYTAGIKIIIDKKGSALKPVIIAAKSTGGVEINGPEGFEIGSSASYVVVQGFKFTHQSGKAKIAVGANHCRVTRNLFECTGKGAYLTVSGDDNQVDYNTFRNKSTEGQMISVQGPGDNEMAKRTWIHHNYFYNFSSVSNNCSSIQVGLSGRSLSSAFTIVEYNLFIRTRGENENICNKSCDNTYRYNTFGEGVSELSLRHGNRCQVYGNFFIGSEGIRFYGDNHLIYNNYFEKCSPAISIGNGDGIIPPDKLVMHDRPDSVQISFNTLINNKVNVIMAGRNSGLGATNIVFSNNIIQGGGPAVKINGTIINPTWEGNIIWETEGPGTIPSGGYISADPLFKQDVNGIYHIQQGSPATCKSIGYFPYVNNDIDGQTRKGIPDIGSDQLSSDNIINSILTVDKVGPNAPF